MHFDTVYNCLAARRQERGGGQGRYGVVVWKEGMHIYIGEAGIGVVALSAEWLRARALYADPAVMVAASSAEERGGEE